MPSTGSALTGRSSPRPAIIAAVTVRTNSGALAGTTAGSSLAEVTRPGISIWCSPASARSTAAWFRVTTSAPRRAYVLAIADLILAIASSRGSTPEMAKKQVCSTVFVRPARPGLAGDPARVDRVYLYPLREDLLLDRAGQRIPDLIRRLRAVEQQRCSRCGQAEHVDPVQQPELMTADEAGLLHQVGRADRLRPETQVGDGLRA